MATLPETLGIAVQHHQAGRLPEAEALCRQVLQGRPGHSDALHLLGVIAHQVGRHDAALECILRAIALNPDVADYHNNIGEVYRMQGRLEEASEHFRRALALNPAFAEVYNNLGLALSARGRRDEALALYRQAVAVKPTFADGYNSLDNALWEQGRLDDAAAQYRQALALKPAYAEACNNLGVVLQEQRRLEEAETHYRRALVLNPAFAETHGNLGLALRDQGRHEEAAACYRRALELRPENVSAHSGLLFDMSYVSDSAEPTGQEYRKWNDRHARHLAARAKPHKNERSPERRLRVGYVSADFRQHSISYFMEPLFAAHDHARVEVFCYSNVKHADATTARVQKSADVWRHIVGMTDEAVADLIAADGIDILVDLSGHTSGNRLLAFARKPAPVQVTYLGSLTTTGLTAIDYRLTDRFLTPDGAAEQFSEELIRLLHCFVCYQPPSGAPPVAALPSSKAGPVTFGSFNNLAKLTPAVAGLWAKILRALPGSKLILKYKTLADAGQRKRLLDLFAQAGISAERLDLRGGTPSPAHLADYSRVDIGLDPLPYNGCTTTCEALWMGVPVITLAGVMPYSRFGVSLLSNLGMEDLIAKTPDEYVEKTVELARDHKRMAALRAELRPRMAASMLCDAKAFARDVEQAYRSMWRKWCGNRA